MRQPQKSSSMLSHGFYFTGLSLPVVAGETPCAMGGGPRRPSARDIACVNAIITKMADDITHTSRDILIWSVYVTQSDRPAGCRFAREACPWSVMVTVIDGPTVLQALSSALPSGTTEGYGLWRSEAELSR